MPTPFQIPSVLLSKQQDVDLIWRLKPALEAEQKRIISIAEVVRIALRKLAEEKQV